MSPEMIAIIAMGIAIVGIQMTTFIYMLRRMDGMQKEISEIRVDMAQMRTELTERIARLEGILIGHNRWRRMARLRRRATTRMRAKA